MVLGMVGQLVGAALRGMARPHDPARLTVAIMFTDLEGFTALTERLGDERAQDILRTHRVLVRTQLRDHGGIEVKTQGDGFMVVFASACAALACAIGIQRAATEAASSAGERVRVRIGIHVGEAIREAGDFFGRTVLVAARIGAAAGGGEILVSEATRDATADRGFGFDHGHECVLKGISAVQRVFAVRWAPLPEPAPCELAVPDAAAAFVAG
jgi:class 3 adenylate cyclase